MPSIRTYVAGPALGLSVLLAATGCATTTGNQEAAQASTTDAQPNILMILVDDLGYTDLGSYGGEIETPHLDALAEDSAQFTQFYTEPVCAPTRAALMTGQDRHRVGLGSMEGIGPPGVPATTPGYKGSLEGEYTGIAEVLGDAGYETYQVGKWHLGDEEGQTPKDLGFDQNFTLYDGAVSYFSDAHRHAPRDTDPVDTAIYERNGDVLESLPEDFFTTRAFTDEMLEMLDDNAESDEPFFGYLAYNAPHDPLHVEDEQLVDHYLDVYLDNNNFEELREDRIERMAELGLIDGDVETRWLELTPEWESLTSAQQEDLAYRMAVYAAVVHETDAHVGRVIEQLKATGEYDDTLIVFASDNGASASTQHFFASQAPEEWSLQAYPSLGDLESYGRQGSYPAMGLPNTQVSSGPFFQAKNTVMEGGIRVPALVKTPEAEETNNHRVIDAIAHISDLYPTFADYAGAELESSDRLMGASAKPLLDGTTEVIGDEEVAWEHFGQRAYRSGDWKLVFVPEPMGGTGDYALYNLATDPGETNDVSAEHPEITKELSAKWDQFAEENGVAVVDFEAVNETAPAIAEIFYSIDWAIEPTEREGTEIE